MNRQYIYFLFQNIDVTPSRTWHTSKMSSLLLSSYRSYIKGEQNQHENPSELHERKKKSKLLFSFCPSPKHPRNDSTQPDFPSHVPHIVIVTHHSYALIHTKNHYPLIRPRSQIHPSMNVRRRLNCIRKPKPRSHHSASPVPSPVHRYSASTSLLLSCCSPKSSGTRPRTCASADRITLRKLR